MSLNKPFGFLQEDFHSEVLSFLLELVSHHFPETELILYNNIDRYNNKRKYTQKYKNLIVKSLDTFIPDMVGDICEKIFVISYDNIFHLSLLLPYRDRLIFIAHSPKHIKAYQDHRIPYFALTSLLSTSFMLPLTNDVSHLSIEYVQPSDDVKNKEAMQNIKDRGFEILMMVGSFFNNNKDLEVIRSLLETKRYIIVICSSELTQDLQDFVREYEEYVYVALNLSTDDLIYTINFFNIRYLLFTPPRDSKFYTSSWSGSLQFAFDCNLRLVLPGIIAQMYDIKNPAIVCYNTTEDIISSLDSGDVLKYSVNEEYQKIRDRVFNRNQTVLQYILEEKPSSNLGHYKINFTEDVNNKVDMYQKLLDNSIKYIDNESKLDANQIVQMRKTKYMQDKTILQVGIDDTIFSLSLLLLERTSKIVHFVQDLQRAKYFKELFVYNNLDKRITFYYAVLGSQNKASYDKNVPESFCLDTLKYTDPIGIIHIRGDLFSEFLLGAKDTIQKYKPLIFVYDNVNQKTSYTNDNILLSNGYVAKFIDNYTLYMC
jgi:hypothetical protein